jgi:hypothetical protein
MRPIVFILLFFIFYSCKNSSVAPINPFGVADLHQLNRKLLEVAMEDGFPPPIASRVYVYPHIAFYSTMQKFYPDSLLSLAGKLNGWLPLDTIETHGAHPELTALLAFTKTAKKVIFSEHLMESMTEHFIAKAKEKGLSTGDRSPIRCSMTTHR